MAPKNTDSYIVIREDFVSVMGAGFSTFAERRGLEMPTAKKLSQMMKPIDDITDEVLGFGFDVWPENSYDDDEGPRSSKPDGGTPGPTGGRGLMGSLSRTTQVLALCAIIGGSAVAPAFAHTVHNCVTKSVCKIFSKPAYAEVLDLG